MTKHFSLATYYRPATQAGGDWWWMHESSTGVLRVLLGDVTGHGAGSAMVTALVGGANYTVHRADADFEFPKLFELVNSVLLDLCHGKYGMTLTALELDPVRSKMRWWSAAAPEIIMRLQGKDLRILPPDLSAPLGSQSFRLNYQEFDLGPDDDVLVFTDGLTEIPLADGSFAGSKTIRRKLMATPGARTPLEVRAVIGDYVSAALGGEPDGSQAIAQAKDDITFLAIHRCL